MISKELLSKVLGLTVVKVPELDGAILWYKGIVNINGSPYAKELSINIYELANKCKEWAKYDKLFGNSGYDLYTEHHRGTNYPSVMGEKPLNKNYNHYICFYNRHNIASSTIGQGITEPEAIFNACQWILDKDSK